MIIINDVLCFIQTARECLDEDSISNMAVAYFTPEIILNAKESFFKTCEVECLRRRQTKQNKNPLIRDIEDITELMVKTEVEKIPQYVSQGYGSIPSNGFEKIANIICSMKDEVSALREELKDSRNEREKDRKILEDNVSFKQDIDLIKTMLKSLSEKKEISKESEKDIKKKAPVKKPIDPKWDRLGNEKTIPSAPSLSEIASTSNSAPGPEISSASNFVNLTKPVEKMSYSTALVSKEGPFTLVNKKKRFKKTKDIKGIGKYDNLNAAKKLVSLYVGRCELATTSNDLIAFCEKTASRQSYLVINIS